MVKEIIQIIVLVHIQFAIAQNTTVINFEEKMIVSKEMVQKAPPMFRDLVQKQLSKTIILSQVFFNNNIVYYQSNVTNKRMNVNGVVSKKDDVTVQDTETTIKSKPIKIKKDFTQHEYIMIENKKTISKPLEKVTWIVTTKTKKILNYNCFLATTTFKGQKLEVYFTKEIAGNASPEKLPFIKGVILEHKTSTKTGIARQVQFNQPDVKNFFQ